MEYPPSGATHAAQGLSKRYTGRRSISIVNGTVPKVDDLCGSRLRSAVVAAGAACGVQMSARLQRIFGAAHALEDFVGRIPCGDGHFVEMIQDAGGRPRYAYHRRQPMKAPQRSTPSSWDTR